MVTAWPNKSEHASLWLMEGGSSEIDNQVNGMDFAEQQAGLIIL